MSFPEVQICQWKMKLHRRNKWKEQRILLYSVGTPWWWMGVLLRTEEDRVTILRYFYRLLSRCQATKYFWRWSFVSHSENMLEGRVSTSYFLWRSKEVSLTESRFLCSKCYCIQELLYNISYKAVLAPSSITMTTISVGNISLVSVWRQT